MLTTRVNTRELDAELRTDQLKIQAQESGDEELSNPSLGVDEAPTDARRR
jgi:hypothetical protein